MVEDSLVEPLDELRALVSAGGKRLRPAFCHCAYIGSGGAPDTTEVIDAAAVLELVHTFALVHDDVMDGSDTRRNRDAVHRHFIQRHTDERWRGDSRRFGEGMAILVGDFAFVYADMLLRSVPAAVFDVFDQLRIELCVGQSLDLVTTATPNTDREAAARHRSVQVGEVTVERPLHLGAARRTSGGPRGAAERVGLPLGAAFQFRDDVLGAFGEADVTGKPVGDDLREGKATPLVALAVTAVRSADRAVLARLGAPDLAVDEIAALQDLFVRTGALKRSSARSSASSPRRTPRSTMAPITPDARDLLAQLADYVAWRDH